MQLPPKVLLARTVAWFTSGRLPQSKEEGDVRLASELDTSPPCLSDGDYDDSPLLGIADDAEVLEAIRREVEFLLKTGELSQTEIDPYWRQRLAELGYPLDTSGLSAVVGPGRPT